MLVGSIQMPLLGKRRVGNDTGMAFGSFRYLDRDGDEHGGIAICAHPISGMVNQTRALKHVITIPMA
jgi:hypothetical protein